MENMWYLPTKALCSWTRKKSIQRDDMMGILKTVVTAPFRLIGAGVKGTKNLIVPNSNSNSEIEMVMKTPSNPQATEQYFDSIGNSTSYFKNYMIVWRPNTPEKNKQKVLGELRNIGV
jgi:hypothetical protein